MSPSSPILLCFLSALLLLPSAIMTEGRRDICSGFTRPSKPCGQINCFRADPVCGADGITYGCGCPDAACAGVRVVHRGPCKV